MYYQYVDAGQDLKPRRGNFNRKLNAIENWASLTQGLVELEELKLQEQMQPMAYDAEDDAGLILYDEYDDESEVYRPRVQPKRGNPKYNRNNQRALLRWRRVTQKLLRSEGAGWGQVQREIPNVKFSPVT